MAFSDILKRTDMHGHCKRRRKFCRGNHCLSDLKNGSYFRIETFTGSRELKNKLYEIGLYPGKTGSVLSANSDGGVVIVSDDLKIMLTSALADSIIINY